MLFKIGTSSGRVTLGKKSSDRCSSILMLDGTDVVNNRRSMGELFIINTEDPIGSIVRTI